MPVVAASDDVDGLVTRRPSLDARRSTPSREIAARLRAWCRGSPAATPTRGTTPRRSWRSCSAAAAPRPSVGFDWLRVDAARGRRLAPVLPGRPGRAGQARRQLRAPTWPPAVWHHWLLYRRPRAPRGDVADGRRRRSSSCSTCRRPAARSSGPATPTARRGRFALLTGSSSICHSLRCAIAIAEELGHERPDWELSAARLARVIRDEPDAFAPKHRWAMDWYYPVLCGRDHRRRRPGAPRRPLRRVRDGGQGRALRVGPPVGHRGRDVRVRDRPPGRRRDRHAPGSCSRGRRRCASRRGPVLDRHRLPRGGALPGRGAVHLHRGGGHPRGRRAGRRQPAPRASSSTTTPLPDADRHRTTHDPVSSNRPDLVSRSDAAGTGPAVAGLSALALAAACSWVSAAVAGPAPAARMAVRGRRPIRPPRRPCRGTGAAGRQHHPPAQLRRGPAARRPIRAAGCRSRSST